jgi:twinkle protein
MKLDEVIDALTVNKQTITDYYNAGYGTSEFKVKDTNVFTDDVIRYFSDEIHSGKSLGFVKTEEDFRIRPAELTVLTGVSGHGKSMWLSQVVLSLMGQDTKCLISSLEMRPVLTLARMIQQTLRTTDPTPEYISTWCSRAAEKLYLYDQTGSTTSDDMIATMYYGKHVLGCGVFIIDSLMKMSDISEDNYEKQKLFIDRLATTCRDLNVHVFLVAHTRKMADETEIPDATHILGSSHIRNLCDNIICVWRNKKKELDVAENNKTEDELKKIPDCLVYLQKQRNYPVEGKWSFWFDKKGLRYTESSR